MFPILIFIADMINLMAVWPLREPILDHVAYSRNILFFLFIINGLYIWTLIISVSYHFSTSETFLIIEFWVLCRWWVHADGLCESIMMCIFRRAEISCLKTYNFRIAVLKRINKYKYLLTLEKLLLVPVWHGFWDYEGAFEHVWIIFLKFFDRRTFRGN